jgi:3-oxoacyl-[acyl-carrier protein] reductase
MTDTYLKLVNSGITSQIARSLKLPRPVVLRRYEASAPLVPGPVLLVGGGAAALAGVLSGWGLDVRNQAAATDKLGAIIVAAEDLSDPAELAAPALALGGALRQLAPGGRVLTVSRAAADAADPATAAVRQGVEAMLRSVARELRAGATGNGILLANGVEITAPSAQAALRFLLSGRSAYVDGQFLRIGSTVGTLPDDWERPLAGRTAVVTGAARGIGAAIAEVLHRDGAQVIAVDVPAAGEQLAAVANRTGGTALQLDITGPDAGERILEHAGGRYGRLDIFVHNAGITRDKLLANMDEARWNSVISVNIAAQLRINTALLASEVFGRRGRIVSLASTSGIAGNRGQANYAASKGGVIGMVRGTAALMADAGGSINAVAPGFIETDMTARMPLLTREVARRLSSLQQGGLPADVAEAVSFLAGDGAAGINGETLRVCGQNLVGA